MPDAGLGALDTSSLIFLSLNIQLLLLTVEVLFFFFPLTWKLQSPLQRAKCAPGLFLICF